MKTLLTQLRADKTPPHSKNSYITHSLTGCTNFITKSGSFDLKPDQFVCVDSSDSLFIALGSSLTIEGVVMEDEKEKTLEPVQNAWGATTGKYKVTASKEETINIHFPPQDISIDWSEKLGQSEYMDIIKKNFTASLNAIHVLSLRKSRSMTLTNKYQVFNDDEKYGYNSEGENLLVFNPNSATVTFYYDENEINLETTPAFKLNDKGYNETSGQWIEIDYRPYDDPLTFPDDITADTNLDEGVGDYKYLVTCDINSESVPPNFPDIDIKLTRNTIYSEDTEQYSFMTGGKLSGGEIAAIVIAVVVVVAIIIVLIVCYCCKLCCFKKKDKSSSSSS